MNDQNRPHWWDAARDLSWSKAKSSVLEEWKRVREKVSERAHKLEEEMQERALGFGHGARDAYSKITSWTTELEGKLKGDWEKTQSGARASWDEVRDAVKHGWEKGLGGPGPGGDKQA